MKICYSYTRYYDPLYTENKCYRLSVSVIEVQCIGQFNFIPLHAVTP